MEKDSGERNWEKKHGKNEFGNRTWERFLKTGLERGPGKRGFGRGNWRKMGWKRSGKRGLHKRVLRNVHENSSWETGVGKRD